MEDSIRFSLAVWNIERFNYLLQRVRAVGQLIKKHDPDVFGILEFLAKDAARKLVRSDDFQPYDFAFTDSGQAMLSFLTNTPIHTTLRAPPQFSPSEGPYLNFFRISWATSLWTMKSSILSFT
jgi:hypothetical protein